MSPRFILGPGLVLLLALFIVAGVDGAESASAGPAPNVVLMVADDLRWSDLGCYGADLLRRRSRRAAREAPFTQR